MTIRDNADGMIVMPGLIDMHCICATQDMNIKRIFGRHRRRRKGRLYGGGLYAEYKSGG